MFGVPPDKLLQAKQAGKHLKAEIEVDKKLGKFSVILKPIDKDGEALVPEMIKQLSGGLGQQLKMFFDINGIMREIK
jgi:hypothetical protein